MTDRRRCCTLSGMVSSASCSSRCASPLLIPGTALRASQVIGGGMCLAALVILVVQSRKPHKPEDLYVNRIRAQNDAAEKDGKATNEPQDKPVG